MQNNMDAEEFNAIEADPFIPAADLIMLRVEVHRAVRKAIGRRDSIAPSRCDPTIRTELLRVGLGCSRESQSAASLESKPRIKHISVQVIFKSSTLESQGILDLISIPIVHKLL